MFGEIKKFPVSLADLEKLAAEGKLYAVLDACGSPLIRAKVRTLDSETVLCLHRTKDENLLKTAPYVARLDGPLLTWLVATVWSEPWGIFLAATVDLKALHRHLRKFLVVKDPEDEVVYFRYYDPRVLPTFMSACNDDELRDFFGPLQVFGVRESNTGKVYFLQRS